MTAGSQKKKTKILYWITLVRACLAFILGFAVLFILLPGERLPLLPNFMGLYWFVGGIFTLRLWMAGEREKPVPLLAGIIGILTGFLVLIGRPFSDDLGLLILGTVITLTGFLRILGGFTMQEKDILHRSKSILFLGFFEVVFGVLLIGVVRIENEFTVYTVAASGLFSVAWSFSVMPCGSARGSCSNRL